MFQIYPIYNPHQPFHLQHQPLIKIKSASVMTFKEHKNQCISITLLYNLNTLFTTNEKMHNRKTFISWVQHQLKHILCFSFLVFNLNEKKASSIEHISFLMSEIKSPNSLIIQFSSLFSTKGGLFIFSINFKFINMAKCKPSLNSQWPWDFFNTQTDTTIDKQSTISWKRCHVRGRSTYLETLIVVYLM